MRYISLNCVTLPNLLLTFARLEHGPLPMLLLLPFSHLLSLPSPVTALIGPKYLFIIVSARTPGKPRVKRRCLTVSALHL
jgi:hypothetical protein